MRHLSRIPSLRDEYRPRQDIMLSPESPAPSGTYVDPYNDGETEAGEIGRYGRKLWEHKWSICASVLLSVAAAAVCTRLQTPIYKAKAALEVQEFNDKFLNRGVVDPVTRVDVAGGNPDLEAELTMLRSRALTRRVVAALHLQRYTQSQRSHRWLRLFGWNQRALPSEQLAISMVEDSLEANAVPGTHVIALTFRAADPRLAADILNALMQQFISQDLETRVAADQHTGQWLAAQVADIKSKLQTSEDQLQAYERASGLMFTDGTISIAEQKLKQIQEQLSTATADRMLKQARFEAASRDAHDSLPEVLSNTTLNQYRVTLTNLRQQLADAETLLTPNHYKVKQLRAQVRELEEALATEQSNIVAGLRSDLGSARAREALLSAAYARQANLVSEQDAKAVRYSMLKREVDTNRQLYDAMLQTVKGANIASALRASNIAVIEAAEPPDLPSSPKPVLNLSIGLATGLLFGMAFALFRARADCTFRKPGELSAYLHLPELGAVPTEGAAKSRPQVARALGRRLLTTIAMGDPQGSAENRFEPSTYDPAASPVGEAFRITLASILSRIKSWNQTSVIVWTSAGSGEGKTTSVTNLGLAMAMTGRRVLLIDGDMRRPRLHDYLKLRNDRGLGDLLQRKEPLEPHALAETIKKTRRPGLEVLTSGPCSGNPADLLYSPRLAELIRLARTMFDAVFIDTPPVLKMADARILASFADAVVLVCRAGETHRAAAAVAAEHLIADGIPILGAILNDWVPDSNGTYLAYERYRVGSRA